MRHGFRRANAQSHVSPIRSSSTGRNEALVEAGLEMARAARRLPHRPRAARDRTTPRGRRRSATARSVFRSLVCSPSSRRRPEWPRATECHRSAAFVLSAFSRVGSARSSHSALAVVVVVVGVVGVCLLVCAAATLLIEMCQVCGCVSARATLRQKGAERTELYSPTCDTGLELPTLASSYIQLTVQHQVCTYNALYGTTTQYLDELVVAYHPEISLMSESDTRLAVRQIRGVEYSNR